jgi:hypothetical protein
MLNYVFGLWCFLCFFLREFHGFCFWMDRWDAIPWKSWPIVTHRDPSTTGVHQRKLRTSESFRDATWHGWRFSIRKWSKVTPRCEWNLTLACRCCWKKSLPWVQSDFILRAKAVVVQNERPIQPWESELVTAPPLRVVSRSFSLFKPPFVCCFTEMNIQVRLDSMILEATNGLERSIPPHMYPSHKGLCCSHVTIPDHPMSRPTIPSGQKKSLLQPIYTPYNHNMQISI